MRAPLAITLLLSMSIAHAQTPPSPTTLATLRDRSRPLLIFAAHPDDPALLAQLHMLKNNAPGRERRDVLVIAVPYDAPSPSETSLTSEDALTARRRFHVAPPDFAVILLGKDGGEKLRSSQPVSFSKLEGLIDSMPMRQQEMQDPQRR